MLAAQTEINELRSKIRSQDKQKVSSLELEALKKMADGLESSKREREGRISELEKALQAETKRRAVAEERSKEAATKASAADPLKKQLDEALANLTTTQTALDSVEAALTEEIDGLKGMLHACAGMYGALAADTVPKSELETERLLRYELRSHLVKMERRLFDKEAQLQELVAYLRCKNEEHKLLQSSLTDAEGEITFLRDKRSLTEEQSLFVMAEAQSLLNGRLMETISTLEGELACAKVMEDYHAGWAQLLLEEYKSAGHCAASLEAALTKVLERTAELDGQLQVANVESGKALKRAKEADVHVSDLQREIENIKERKEQQILDLATEKDTLAEEGMEVRRKWDEARRRIEKLETAVREKTAAERALSGDVEGYAPA